VSGLHDWEARDSPLGHLLTVAHPHGLEVGGG
jgi:hypothetical protein